MAYLHHNLPSWDTDRSDDSTFDLSTGNPTTETIPFIFWQEAPCADVHRDIPIYRREGDALIIRGFVIDTVKGYIGHMDGNDKSLLMKWQKAIPSGKEANHILFGEDSPSLESLEQLREKTLQNDAITSYL